MLIVSLTVRLSACLVYLFASGCYCVFVCVPVCLFACLFICLFVCLFVSACLVAGLVSFCAFLFI